MPPLIISNWNTAGDKLTPSGLNSRHSEIEAVVNAIDKDNIKAGAGIRLADIDTSFSTKQIFKLTTSKDSLLCDYLQNVEIEKVSDTSIALKVPQLPDGTTSIRGYVPAIVSEDGMIGIAVSAPTAVTILGTEAAGVKYVYAAISDTGTITLEVSATSPTAIGSNRYYLGYCYWDGSKIRSIHPRYKQRPVSEYMPGYIEGCNLSYVDANKVNISSGKIRFESSFDGNGKPIDVIVDSVPQLEVNFTNSGHGGLDAGDLRDKCTWYYIYLIFGVNGIKALASKNPTTPTTSLATTYNYYRRIGSVFLLGDSAKSVCGFLQQGKYNLRKYVYEPFGSQFDTGGTVSTTGANNTVTGVGTAFDASLIGATIHFLISGRQYPEATYETAVITAVAGATSLTAYPINGGVIPAHAAGTSYKIDFQGFPPRDRNSWTQAGATYNPYTTTKLRVPQTAKSAILNYIFDHGIDDNKYRVLIRPYGSSNSHGIAELFAGLFGVQSTVEVFLLSIAGNGIEFNLFSTIAADTGLFSSWDNSPVGVWPQCRWYITGYTEEV